MMENIIQAFFNKQMIIFYIIGVILCLIMWRFMDNINNFLEIIENTKIAKILANISDKIDDIGESQPVKDIENGCFALFILIGGIVLFVYIIFC